MASEYFELWLKTISKLGFQFDDINDAQKFASLMLKGSKTINRVCIVGSDDAPEGAVDAMSGGDDCLFIRSRDIVPGSGSWFLVTKADDASL